MFTKYFPGDLLIEALDATGHEADVIEAGADGVTLKITPAQTVMLFAELGRVIAQHFAGDDDHLRDVLLGDMINLADDVRIEGLGRREQARFPGWTLAEQIMTVTRPQK